MRLFEILDKMNVNDGENKTSFLGVCDGVVACDVKKNNATITMGVPREVGLNYINDNNIKPLLMLVNLEEYEKIKAQEDGK